MIINCAAISPSLVETELFGCNKGAYTGAHEREGLVAAAEKGTLILDEVHALGYDHQTALLHLVEEGTFRKVGCSTELQTTARVIGITNQNLEKEIKGGRFREDLLYRFVYQVDVPPLRERSEDVIPLFEYYLRASPFNPDGSIKLLLDECAHQLRTHPWPGNARMIVRAVERLLSEMESWESTISTQQILGLLGQTAQGSSDILPEAPQPQVPVLERLASRKETEERDAILTTLNQTRWNRKRAAALLQVDYKALLYRMKKLGIEDSAIQ